MLLNRLAKHHGLCADDLSRLSSVPAAEVRAVLDGAPPGASLLRRLAPVFQLEAEDLYVIAAAALPLEMTPLDPRAGTTVARLAWHAARLPRDQRYQLRRLAQSLPQERRTQPDPEPRAHLQYPPGPGGLLMRLLANRNLGWLAGAQTFLTLTGRYWSAATYGQVGHGCIELTPDLLADYAIVLGIRADDLAALTGVKLQDRTAPPSEVAVDVTGLIWDVRRLTLDQIQHLRDTAKSTS
ncbi:hypothetical protein QF037_000698 [Streptomyces canus]|uniref:hypothetical protein n=1 Tax=Streptomyces canus TaxID=58343 RepID=UPI00278A6B38|nr:hypothetical protein [Streptomyces canus]MDQ0596353.1 hypothetical protein [Streptomyces canus]